MVGFVFVAGQEAESELNSDKRFMFERASVFLCKRFEGHGK